MTHSGRASVQSTHHHLDQFPQLLRSRLGKTDWSITQAGMGLYRMAEGQPDHEAALKAALEAGINVFDTSSNYADGASETLLGNAINDYVESGGDRSNLVLVSKAGYLQGQILESAYTKEATGKGYQDLVMLTDELHHCIHPSFLEDSLTATLERLGVETLDVFLIHNPEYYLLWAQQDGMDVEEARTVMYDRLQVAFTYLESEVSKGRIQAFGISSNTLGYSVDHAHFLSLERVLESAVNCAHFSVVQTPLNLLETGFVTQINNGDYTAYQIARESDLGVLINRPLNAIYQDQLYRLITLETEIHPEVDEVNEMVNSLEAKESLFFESPSIQNLSDKNKEQLKVLFNIGQTFQTHWQQCQGYEQWKDLLAHFFFPQMEHAVKFLQTELPDDGEVAIWMQGYLQRFADTAQHITAWYKCRGRGFRDTLVESLHNQHPEWIETDTLEALSIRFIRLTEGISGALVGMRLVDYVGATIEELSQPFPQTLSEEEWKQWSKETVFSA